MTSPSTTEAPTALSLDQVEAAATRLSAEERAELLQYLIELNHPAEPDVQAAWDQEINRRLEEVRSGEVKCIPFDEVMAEMREKYGK